MDRKNMSELCKSSVADKFEEYVKQIRGKTYIEASKAVEFLNQVPTARKYREIKGLFNYVKDSHPLHFIKNVVYTVAKTYKNNQNILNLCSSFAETLKDEGLNNALILMRNPQDAKAASALISCLKKQYTISISDNFISSVEGEECVINAIKFNHGNKSVIKDTLEAIRSVGKVYDNSGLSGRNFERDLIYTLLKSNPTDARVVNLGLMFADNARSVRDFTIPLSILANANKQDYDIMNKISERVVNFKHEEPQIENGVKGIILSNILDLQETNNVQLILDYARKSNNNGKVALLTKLAKVQAGNSKFAKELLNFPLDVKSGDVTIGEAVNEIYSAVLTNNPSNNSLRKQAISNAREYLNNPHTQAGFNYIEEFIKNTESTAQLQRPVWKNIKQTLKFGS